MDRTLDRTARLRDGQAFHTLVARYFQYEPGGHDGQFLVERVLNKASGKAGRADLILWEDENAVLIETKWTDWDELQRRGTLRRNLAAHRRQVWSYIDGTFFPEGGFKGPGSDLTTVERQGWMVYPTAPETAGFRVRIEEELGKWGISVVWFDQPAPADSQGGKAQAALKSGEIPTHDLVGSAYWEAYLRRLVAVL